MTASRFYVSLIWGVFLIGSSIARASSFTADTNNADNGTDSFFPPGAPNTNYSTGTFGNDLQVTGDASRAVLHFDLSGIAGQYAAINSITLNFTVDFNYNNSPDTVPDVDIHALTDSYVESQVTYNSRSTGTPWATPGGDYDASVLGSFDPNALSQTALAIGAGTEHFSVTLLGSDAAGREALVNALAGGTDFGFLIKSDNEAEVAAASAAGFAQYVGLQSGNTANAPQIVINYTPVPEPAGALLMFCLGGAGLLKRERAS